MTGLPPQYFGTPALPAPGRRRSASRATSTCSTSTRSAASRRAPAARTRSSSASARAAACGRARASGPATAATSTSRPPSANGGGSFDVYKYGLSGAGKPSLSLAGELRRRVRLGQRRAGHHLRRHDVRHGAGVDRLVGQPIGQQARSCAPMTRCRSNGKPVLRFRRRSARLRTTACPASAPAALYVGTREGKVLAFGSPVTPPLTGSALSLPDDDDRRAAARRR